MHRLRSKLAPLPAPIQAVFRPEALVSVTTAVQQPLQWCRGKTAVLCSGIGHAASFRATADVLGVTVLDEIAYADHHRYTSGDLERLRAIVKEVKAEVVITTEKDAGKLAPLLTRGRGLVVFVSDGNHGRGRPLRQAIGCSPRGRRLSMHTTSDAHVVRGRTGSRRSHVRAGVRGLKRLFPHANLSSWSAAVATLQIISDRSYPDYGIRASCWVDRKWALASELGRLIRYGGPFRMPLRCPPAFGAESAAVRICHRWDESASFRSIDRGPAPGVHKCVIIGTCCTHLG